MLQLGKCLGFKHDLEGTFNEANKLNDGHEDPSPTCSASTHATDSSPMCFQHGASSSQPFFLRRDDSGFSTISTASVISSPTSAGLVTPPLSPSPIPTKSCKGGLLMRRPNRFPSNGSKATIICAIEEDSEEEDAVTPLTTQVQLNDFLDEQAQLQPLGDESKAPQASRGSALHSVGDCSPCVWCWKPQGCRRGADCCYCHLCPEGELKARKRAKRDAQEAGTEPSSTVQEPLQPLPSECSTANGTDECRPGAWKDPAVLSCEAMLPQRSVPPPPIAPPSCLLMEPLESPGSPPAGHATTQGLIPPPPGLAVPRSAVTSAGSELHGTGMCRPCAWLWKPRGCLNAVDCRHCHLCPEGEIRARRQMKLEILRHEPLTIGMASPTSPNLSLDKLLSFKDADCGSEDGDDQEPRLVKLSPKSSPSLHCERQQTLCSALGLSSGLGGLGDANTPEFVPRSVASLVLLIGSAAHAEGTCRPCAWFWKPSGCENGLDCRHCHQCDEGEIKARRRMKHAQASAEEQPAAPVPAPPQWNVSPRAIAVETSREAAFISNEPLPLYVPLPARPAPLPSHAASSPIAISCGDLLPSVGSATHAQGQCRPCAWFYKPQSCLNGQACGHCHLCPEGEFRNRKKVKELSLAAAASVPAMVQVPSPRVLQIAPMSGA